MSIELFGSALIIVLLALFGRAHWRMWLYGALFVFVVSFASNYPFFGMYSLFVAGMMLAEWHVSGACRFPGHKYVLAGLFVLGFLAPLLSGHKASAFYMSAVVGFCAAVFYLRPLQHFFEGRVSRFLGRISFPLYLLHGPIMYSFSLFLLARLEAIGMDVGPRNLVVAIASVPVSIIAATLFSSVNEFAIRWSRKFGVEVVSAAQMIGRRMAARTMPSP